MRSMVGEAPFWKPMAQGSGSSAQAEFTKLQTATNIAAATQGIRCMPLPPCAGHLGTAFNPRNLGVDREAV
jgi:hypothetical protein